MRSGSTRASPTQTTSPGGGDAPMPGGTTSGETTAKKKGTSPQRRRLAPQVGGGGDGSNNRRRPYNRKKKRTDAAASTVSEGEAPPYPRDAASDVEPSPAASSYATTPLMPNMFPAASPPPRRTEAEAAAAAAAKATANPKSDGGVESGEGVVGRGRGIDLATEIQLLKQRQPPPRPSADAADDDDRGAEILSVIAQALGSPPLARAALLLLRAMRETGTLEAIQRRKTQWLLQQGLKELQGRPAGGEAASVKSSDRDAEPSQGSPPIMAASSSDAVVKPKPKPALPSPTPLPSLPVRPPLLSRGRSLPPPETSLAPLPLRPRPWTPTAYYRSSSVGPDPAVGRVPVDSGPPSWCRLDGDEVHTLNLLCDDQSSSSSSSSSPTPSSLPPSSAADAAANAGGDSAVVRSGTSGGIIDGIGKGGTAAGALLLTPVNRAGATMEAARMPARPLPVIPSISPQERLNRILLSRGYSVRTRPRRARRAPPPTDLRVASYGAAVFRAVHRSDPASLSSLLGCGLSPNPCDAFSDSVLDAVCRRSDYALFCVMVDAGADVRNAADSLGRTPLHHAAWAGPRADFRIVRDLLDMDRTMLRATDDRGRTPLDFVPSEAWAAWIDFLERNADRYWPRRGDGWREREEEERPAIVVQPADPPDALPVELARAVASGRMEPSEAARLRRGAAGRSSRERETTAAPLTAVAPPLPAVAAASAAASPKSGPAEARERMARPEATTMLENHAKERFSAVSIGRAESRGTVPADAAAGMTKVAPDIPAMANRKSIEPSDEKRKLSPAKGMTLPSKRRRRQKRKTLTSRCA